MKTKKQYFFEMKVMTLNVLSTLLLLFMLLITIFIMKTINVEFNINDFEIKIISLLLFPYFFIHEILHSIGYVVNGASFKRITYGMHLEKGILCCSCKQEISKKNILWSLMYPFIFIGIITYIFGIVFNLKILIVLSIFNIAGCVGDLVMFYNFIKIGDFRFFEYDNPMAFGIITEEKLDSSNMFGLKKISEKKIEQTINKKISISKTSILILLIYTLICLINILL